MSQPPSPLASPSFSPRPPRTPPPPPPRAVARLAALLLLAGVAATPSDPPRVTTEAIDPDVVRLGWEAARPDFVLQSAGDFDHPEEWSTWLVAPTLEADEIVHYLIPPVDAPVWFFRLRSQETSGVLGGRNFLNDSQNTIGNWGFGAGNPLQETTAALEVLMHFDPAHLPTGESIIDTIAGLHGLQPRNHDELSRQIIGLSLLGQAVDPQAETLLAAENDVISQSADPGFPGGGWGLAPGFGDSTIDTALALRALRAAGIPLGLTIFNESVPTGATSPSHAVEVPAGATSVFLDVRELSGNARFNLNIPGSGTSFVDLGAGSVPIRIGPLPTNAGMWEVSVVNQAGAPLTYSAELNFLTGDSIDVSRLTAAATYLGRMQNSDGGWGTGPATESHLMITAEVVKTLAGYAGTFQSVIDDAASWLLAEKQNGDGGFSSAPGASNVLETALAVVAIRSSSLGVSLDPAVGLIEGAQLLNGSWENDPYLTAVALQALAQPPVVSPISDQAVVAPAAFAPIDLDVQVDDPQHPDAAIVWSVVLASLPTADDLELPEPAEPEPVVTAPSGLTVSIVDRVATISYPAGTEASEIVRFIAVNPDGLAASSEATFTVSTTPPVDYTIARHGSTSDSGAFTTTPAVFSQVAFYTESQLGLPAGVTYSTTTVSSNGVDTFFIDFQIAVDGTAATGIHSFSVEYGLADAGNNPLTPLFGNVFNFTIEVTP